MITLFNIYDTPLYMFNVFKNVISLILPLSHNFLYSNIFCIYEVNIISFYVIMALGLRLPNPVLYKQPLPYSCRTLSAFFNPYKCLLSKMHYFNRVCERETTFSLLHQMKSPLPQDRNYWITWHIFWCKCHFYHILNFYTYLGLFPGFYSVSLTLYQQRLML